MLHSSEDLLDIHLLKQQGMAHPFLRPLRQVYLPQRERRFPASLDLDELSSDVSLPFL